MADLERETRRPETNDLAESSSLDLGHELQSKMFDQLATMGVGGAGLTITLIGTILRAASPIVWLAVVEFGLAALVGLAGHFQLIEGIFNRTSTRRQCRVMTIIGILLIGMGIGSLGTSVVLQGHAF